MRRPRLQKLENAADLMIVGLIVMLALAMLYGLLTASGTVVW